MPPSADHDEADHKQFWKFDKDEVGFTDGVLGLLCTLQALYVFVRVYAYVCVCYTHRYTQTDTDTHRQTDTYTV